MMAKSIRSKSKRRNRSLLRKQVCQPIITQRQNNISKNLQKSIKEKNGSSIAGLKSIFQKKEKAEEEDAMEEDSGSDHDDEDIEDDSAKNDKTHDLSEDKTSKLKSQKRVKDKFKNSDAKKEKKLVWF